MSEWCWCTSLYHHIDYHYRNVVSESKLIKVDCSRMCFPFVLFLLLLVPFLSSSELSCISVPVFDEYDATSYFACTCPQYNMAGHFSLATFAYHLPQGILDKYLVVDFRECSTLHLIMDQLDLLNTESGLFRPSLQFRGLKVENIAEVSKTS